jgi:hypothetical protein
MLSVVILRFEHVAGQFSRQIKLFWTASGRRLKVKGEEGRQSERKAIKLKEVRRYTMNSKDAFILTHYTDITEAKQRDVRQLHAEATRTVIRAMIATLRRVFLTAAIGTQSCSGRKLSSTTKSRSRRPVVWRRRRWSR